MALTTAQQVRLKIQDPLIRVIVNKYGDGLADTFMLDHTNITNAVAFVPVGGTAWSATAASFDANGAVSFSNVISASSAYKLDYQYSVFSDDEIDHFIAVGGNVIGGAKEACEALIFDAVKRARWMASDGSQYDDTSAQSHLLKMHALLTSEMEKDSVSAGGFNSWSESQGGW